VHAMFSGMIHESQLTRELKVPNLKELVWKTHGHVPPAVQLLDQLSALLSCYVTMNLTVRQEDPASQAEFRKAHEAMAVFAPIATRTVAQFTLLEATQHSEAVQALKKTFNPKPTGAESAGVWMMRTVLTFNRVARPSYLSKLEGKKVRPASIPFFEVQSHVLKLQKSSGILVLRSAWHMVVSMCLFALNQKKLKDGSMLRDSRLDEDSWAKTFRPLIDPGIRELTRRNHPNNRFCPIPGVLQGDDRSFTPTTTSLASASSSSSSSSSSAASASSVISSVAEPDLGGGRDSRKEHYADGHSCLLCNSKHSKRNFNLKAQSGVLEFPYEPWFARRENAPVYAVGGGAPPFSCPASASMTAPGPTAPAAEAAETTAEEPHPRKLART